jgi:hypothetical protein
VSDADLAVVERQLGEFEPLDEIPGERPATLRTDQPVSEILAELEERVNAASLG